VYIYDIHMHNIVSFSFWTILTFGFISHENKHLDGFKNKATLITANGGAQIGPSTL
jgi:hypothetical protein